MVRKIAPISENHYIVAGEKCELRKCDSRYGSQLGQYCPRISSSTTLCRCNTPRGAHGSCFRLSDTLIRVHVRSREGLNGAAAMTGVAVASPDKLLLANTLSYGAEIFMCFRNWLVHLAPLHPHFARVRKCSRQELHHDHPNSNG